MNKVIVNTVLFCKFGSSDKEYHIQITEATAGFNVDFKYGRRGDALKCGTKNKAPLSLPAAEKLYNSVIKEKLNASPPYIEAGANANAVPVEQAVNSDIFIPHLLKPIDEDEVEIYLNDDMYCAQEKKDGKHITIDIKANKIIVRNKNGKSITSEDFKNNFLQDGFIDCEKVGDALFVFDIMRIKSRDITKLGYADRILALKEYISKYTAGVVMVPVITKKFKRTLFNTLKNNGMEGIVFKKLDASYCCGARNDDMLKFKFTSTLSARVCKGREGKRSIGLQLIDKNGKWINVGNCTIPINHKPPITLDIAEIRYLYAYKDGSLFQPVYLGPRDDVKEHECSMDQLKYKKEE